MVDTERLRKAVKHFRFVTSPSNTNRAAPCTIGDLNDVIDEIAKLLNTFIDEIENDQPEQ